MKRKITGDDQLAVEDDLRDVMQDPERFPTGSVSFVEFASGGDPGFPDTMVLGEDRWIPLELKCGNILRALRPAQVRWHKTSLIGGVPTFAISISRRGFQVWLVRFKLDDDRKLAFDPVATWPIDEFNYPDLLWKLQPAAEGRPLEIDGLVVGEDI